MERSYSGRSPLRLSSCAGFSFEDEWGGLGLPVPALRLKRGSEKSRPTELRGRCSRLSARPMLSHDSSLLSTTGDKHSIRKTHLSCHPILRHQVPQSCTSWSVRPSVSSFIHCSFVCLFVHSLSHPLAHSLIDNLFIHLFIHPCIHTLIHPSIHP